MDISQAIHLGEFLLYYLVFKRFVLFIVVGLLFSMMLLQHFQLWMEPLIPHKSKGRSLLVVPITIEG